MIVTNPAQPALLSPLAGHFAEATGWPIQAALISVTLASSTSGEREIIRSRLARWRAVSVIWTPPLLPPVGALSRAKESLLRAMGAVADGAAGRMSIPLILFVITATY
jgi:hypothetical protein